MLSTVHSESVSAGEKYWHDMLTAENNKGSEGGSDISVTHLRKLPTHDSQV